MYVVVESCIICAHELCSSAKMLLYKKQFLLTHPLMLSVQHKLVAVVKGSQHKWLGLNGNSLQCSFLENPRDRGAWWVAVYGVAQSRT